jgi:hypothetical protein
MLQGSVVIAVSFVYLGLLFAVAWWGDKRADGPFADCQSDHLRPVDGRLLHDLDILRQRWSRSGVGNRLSAGLPWADAGDDARLASCC